MIGRVDFSKRLFSFTIANSYPVCLLSSTFILYFVVICATCGKRVQKSTEAQKVSIETQCKVSLISRIIIFID